MQSVIENGPWMVENKPLFVRKWEPGLCMSKLDTSKLPLWVKIYDIPLEAWNVEGISRISSRIGVPIIMDKITTLICEKPYGRASYARVLVEVDAAKGLVDSVEIWYKSLSKSMMLNVEYVWKPSICDHCKTFEHFSNFCGKAQVSIDKKNCNDGNVKSNVFVGNVNGDHDRGYMGYRGSNRFNNRGRSSSGVDNWATNSLVKYVPVKSNEKVVTVDECLVADEVTKEVSNADIGSSANKGSSDNGLGKAKVNGKVNDTSVKESVLVEEVSLKNRFEVLNEDDVDGNSDK
ncbi:ATPase, F1/V1/A1 complex, alpha/beta subunit [Tanacetum coccineum]|uniref:ATPase, F1/V1/A1 complex, alpha/beta subunit n=1 Tax=Tanacetum coccineum TaxID=301880 RepID=A0ABQ5GL30_9ASTR